MERKNNKILAISVLVAAFICLIIGLLYFMGAQPYITFEGDELVIVNGSTSKKSYFGFVKVTSVKKQLLPIGSEVIYAESLTPTIFKPGHKIEFEATFSVIGKDRDKWEIVKFAPYHWRKITLSGDFDPKAEPVMQSLRDQVESIDRTHLFAVIEDSLHAEILSLLQTYKGNEALINNDHEALLKCLKTDLKSVWNGAISALAIESCNADKNVKDRMTITKIAAENLNREQLESRIEYRFSKGVFDASLHQLFFAICVILVIIAIIALFVGSDGGGGFFLSMLGGG